MKESKRSKMNTGQTKQATNGQPDLTIRPFDYSEADYEALIGVRNAIEPERPSSVAAWKHWDKHREEKYRYWRYLAERDGEVVGAAAVGHTAWSYHPHKFFVDVHVHPEHQRQGIGNQLYQHLMAHLQPRQPRKLVSNTREHRLDAIRFLNKRGFHQVMRIPVSSLDPATFDNERFEAKVQRVLASGIEIKTLKELSVEDPNWKRKAYELEWECLQDVPSTDPFTKRSFENFEKGVLQSPNLIPDAWFVAVDGDRYVGLSVLWRNLNTDKLLETGLTGVVRSHRRRGIATAMKVRAIEYAQQHGNPLIDTDNEENNPMFQLNLQLGFVPQPAHLEFEKKIPVVVAEDGAASRKTQASPV